MITNIIFIIRDTHILGASRQTNRDKPQTKKEKRPSYEIFEKRLHILLFIVRLSKMKLVITNIKL